MKTRGIATFILGEKIKTLFGSFTVSIIPSFQLFSALNNTAISLESADKARGRTYGVPLREKLLWPDNAQVKKFLNKEAKPVIHSKHCKKSIVNVEYPTSPVPDFPIFRINRGIYSEYASGTFITSLNMSRVPMNVYQMKKSNNY